MSQYVAVYVSPVNAAERCYPIYHFIGNHTEGPKIAFNLLIVIILENSFKHIYENEK
jgi:hypothetical protein